MRIISRLVSQDLFNGLFGLEGRCIEQRRPVILLAYEQGNFCLAEESIR
jgi:hypothetical protein